MINFPSSPSPNQIYTFGGKSWIWNGYGWLSLGGVVTGATSSIGDYVSYLNGFTGGVTLFAGDGINFITGSKTITINNDLFVLIDGGTY